jgi:glycosyltransferase involved in cell wall biosynthesis
LITTPWYPTPEVPIRGVWTIGHARAVAAEHDVVMLPFSPRAGAAAPFELEDRVDEGVRRIEIVHPPTKVPGPGLVAVRRATTEALRRLERDGFVPDVIHGHVFLSAPAALTAKRLTGAPLLINEHLSRVTDWRLTRLERLMARYTYPRAELVCTTAERMLPRVEKLGAKRTLQVADTIDTDQFHPGDRTRGPGEVRAIAAGSLNEKKGHRYLLDALARAREHVPGLTLDLVGDGELRSDLERQARSLGVDDSVRFHGYVSRERLAEMMREADLHVLPSLRESQPHVVAEALATGLPSVAADAGGTAEMLQGGGGVVVPPADSEAFAEALVDVCSRLDSFDRHELASRARERYGPAASTRMWTEIYSGLVEGR